MQKTADIDPDTEQILISLNHSFKTMDTAGIIRSLQDLVDSEHSDLWIYSRMISTTGDRIKLKASYPAAKLVIISVNGIANHVLCAKYYEILSEGLDESEYYKHFKHMNDLDPDEFAWWSE